MTELELAHAMLIMAESQILNLCGYKKMMSEKMFDEIINEISYAQSLEAKANGGDKNAAAKFVDLAKTFDKKILDLFHSRPDSIESEIYMR